MFLNLLTYFQTVRRKIFIFSALSFFSLLTLSHAFVYFTTVDYQYKSLQKVPYNKVGVLLGTSKYMTQGGINPFYQNRIDAAVELFRSGKISFILVSGDNATLSYNEPIMIKHDLLKYGIPEKKIFLDFAGFRTFDSMIRAKKVFGLSQFTVISQNFHSQRAIFIARQNGVAAIAYHADAVGFWHGTQTYIRESFARVKAILDVFVLNTQPKFLGDPIVIQ